MKRDMSIDMTSGPLLGKILLFSLPLMAANILQLLFNTADIVVVGRFAGHASLAAVGSTTSVIYLFINLLVGISVGVNVVIARYLGEKERQKEISLALHTAVTVALVGGAALGVVGILASEPVLELIQVPDDVRPLALVYLRIYFAGTPFTMLYNYGAAALRSTGDTRRPLVFLSISGVVNVALNLLLVIVFRMDVAGVALATVTSMALSSLLILGSLSRGQGEVQFSWRRLCLDRRSLASMARIGIPAGIQSCLFSLSNVVIQGAINSYGSVMMAGSSASDSIENFLYVSMNSFHHSCQTFASQNVGAGRYDRVRKVVRTCILCSVGLGLVLCSGAMVLAPQLVSIYNQDAAVIAAGAARLRTLAMFYVIFGIADVLVGAIRGCGEPIVPVIINLLGTCVFRLIWIHFLDTARLGVEWVYFCYPISWSIITVALFLFWQHLRRRTIPDGITLDQVTPPSLLRLKKHSSAGERPS